MLSTYLQTLAMKKNRLIFFSLFLGTVLFGQADTVDTLVFPTTWQGQLQIYSAKGLQQTVPMELDIQPMDTSVHWTWAITYGEDKVAGRRAYELTPVDTTIGRFEIDEKNSIVLDAQLLGTTFVSRFEVMGNLLTSVYEKKDDAILFTILMGNATDKTETGGGVMNGDTIPMVYSYQVGVLQRARLERKVAAQKD